MIWFLQAKEFSNPITVVYLVWTGIQVGAAITLAVMLPSPTWRDKLATSGGCTIWILGMLGWVKIAIFGLFDLSMWNRQLGDIAFVIAAIVLLVASLFAVVRWLRDRLREPQPLRQIGRGVIVFGIPLVGGALAFDWMDYHAKGEAPLLGANPRCVDYKFAYCFKLNTTDLSWDAAAAMWLDRWQFLVFLAIIGAVWMVILLRDHLQRRSAAPH